MLMHTLKKRLKEIDECYEIESVDARGNIEYQVYYQSKFGRYRVLSFDKKAMDLAPTFGFSLPHYKPEVLTDLWQIIKLVSEYLN